MEFGSKYVYNYSDSEEESVSDDEFETGMGETRVDDTSPPVLEAALYETAPVMAALSANSGPSLAAASAAATNSLTTDSAKLSARALSDDSGRTFMCDATDAKSSSSKPRSKLHKWMMSKPSKEPVHTEFSSLHSHSGHHHQQQHSGGGGNGDRGRGSGRRSVTVATAAGKRWRRADTNVVAVKFDQLTKPSNMHTGDAVSCKQCRAMLSHISKITEQGEDKVWQCEFCGESNLVDLLPDELPTQPDVTYMMKPAAVTTASSCLGVEESFVVFCVDTSGSMCVSQEVAGKLKLRASHAERYRSLNDTGENQWMPGQNRNVTYITRLQALQAAVDHQLDQLAREHSSRKVILVTFSSEVIIVGDGTMTPVTIAGDKLSDYDELTQTAGSLDIPTRIETSRAVLGEKVFSLEEGGQTALGPAMLVAITMASKVAGSKVIMCTDGLANVGLGNLDCVATDQYKLASEFYRKLGETAKSRGVTVSVLTIAGTECKLVELGAVASATGGQVNVVDPLKLTEEFGNILANPVIASRVGATFIVHKGLYIRNEPELKSSIKRDVGNVTKDTEITFEYGIRRHARRQHHTPTDAKHDVQPESPSATGGHKEADADESTKARPAAAAGDAETARDDVAGESPAAAAKSDAAEAGTGRSSPTELPFQVQIEYTDLDGAEALRVITQLQPVTKDRQQAETNINVPVVGTHATQQSSLFALEGHYTPSRMNAFMYQRLVYRNVNDRNDYDAYISNVAPLEGHIRSAQRVEASSRGRSMTSYEEMDYDSDNEADEGLADVAAATGSASKGIGSRLSQFFGFGGKSAPARSAPSAPAAVSHAAKPAAYGMTMRRRQCSDTMSTEMYKSKQVSSKMFVTKPERSSVPPPPKPVGSGPVVPAVSPAAPAACSLTGTIPSSPSAALPAGTAPAGVPLDPQSAAETTGVAAGEDRAGRTEEAAAAAAGDVVPNDEPAAAPKDDGHVSG